MLQLISLLILACGLGLFLLCLRGWYFSYQKLRLGEPILEQQPGPTVAWGILDILAGMFLFVVISSFYMLLALKAAGIPEFTEEVRKTTAGQLAFLCSFSLAEMSVFALLALGIFLRSGKAFLFGEDTEKFTKDLQLGVVAYAMAIFPVLAIQILLTQFWEYEHPLIDDLEKNLTVSLAITSFISAVICAPLFEEFAIRLLLQGWLTDLFDRRLQDLEILWGKWHRFQKDSIPLPQNEEYKTEAEPVEEFSEQSLDDIEIPHANLSDNPFAAPITNTQTKQFTEEFSDEEPASIPRFWQLSILISSLIFAALHIGQGPAPIPLFFLALMLGYLYQRTRRITACLTVHFLLNFQSMLLLILQLYFPEQ